MKTNTIQIPLGNHSAPLKIMLILLLIAGITNDLLAAKSRQINAINAFTGAGTYCLNATPTNLSVTLGTCTSGSGSGTNNTNFTITWYYNTTNSTSTSGATQVSQTNTNTGTLTYTYTPSTTTVSYRYYFAVLSNPSSTACGFDPTLSTGTQLVVVEQPTAVTIAPTSAIICNGSIQQLTASGGLFTAYTPTVAFTELFNGTSTGFTVSGTGATAVRNSTYYSEGSYSYLFNQPNTNAAGNYSQTSAINLSGYASAVLTFSHICATEQTFDFGYVEYSTNGGTSYTTFPTSSYGGSGSLKNSVVSFDASSYTDWNSRFTSTSSTPGTGPATSLWKTETIYIPASALTNNFKIRFRYTTDSGVNYYGWLLDNLAITGFTQVNVNSFTWSPITNLYTNAGATTAYTAGAVLSTVYAKPSAAATYTATSTSGAGCTSSANVVVTLSALPTITLGTINNICTGSTSFTIPYTATTGSPNQYSISGTGITTVTNGTLSASPITVNLSSPASGSSISFTLTASNSSAGCVSGNVNGSVTVNALPTFSYTSTNITCNGLTNGSITITASGGTGPYTYSLLNGDNFPYNGDSPHTIPNLLPNTYSLQVKDSNNCIQTTCQ